MSKWDDVLDRLEDHSEGLRNYAKSLQSNKKWYYADRRPQEEEVVNTVGGSDGNVEVGSLGVNWRDDF